MHIARPCAVPCTEFRWNDVTHYAKANLRRWMNSGASIPWPLFGGEWARNKLQFSPAATEDTKRIKIKFHVWRRVLSDSVIFINSNLKHILYLESSKHARSRWIEVETVFVDSGNGLRLCLPFDRREMKKKKQAKLLLFLFVACGLSGRSRDTFKQCEATAKQREYSQ